MAKKCEYFICGHIDADAYMRPNEGVVVDLKSLDDHNFSRSVTYGRFSANAHLALSVSSEFLGSTQGVQNRDQYEKLRDIRQNRNGSGQVPQFMLHIVAAIAILHMKNVTIKLRQLGSRVATKKKYWTS